MLYYSSASRKPKEWRLLSLLPADARLRSIQFVSEAIGMTAILILWRISIYIIELLLNLYTMQKAIDRFFGLDLIIILLISMMSRVSANKVNVRNAKNKRAYITVYALSTILLCIHVILFILNIKLGWPRISFMILAYLSIAAIWYVLLLELRGWDFNYETMIAKQVKQ
jgi:hypothetical protein